MPIMHTLNNEVTVVNTVTATRVIDATPVEGTDLDVRTLEAGSRLLLIMDAFETNVANTGGTWSVGESETDGGTYTAATTDGSLAATGETPGNVNRTVSILPNPAKPFVRPLFTGADAAAEVDITANFVVVPRTL